MTKAEKQAYKDILESLGGERDFNYIITMLILLPTLTRDEPFFFHPVIDWLLLIIFVILEVHNYLKKLRAKKIVKWTAFEAELIDKQNLKEKLWGHQFDGVCRFMDANDTEIVKTVEKVKISLVPKIFRPKTGPRITYHAKCYVNPRNSEDMYCAIVANGQDARKIF